MRFGIIDRYIFKEMLGPFFVGLVAYSFLFVVNLLFQLAELSIQQGLSPTVSIFLFFLSLPSLLAYTLPIALLVGTIIAFSRLSADSEVVALRASGVPLAKLLRAPLTFGTFLILLVVPCLYVILGDLGLATKPTEDLPETEATERG